MNANVDLTDVVLETDRLIIREWSEMNLEDLFEYAKVDGVGQMAGWNPHTSIQESKNILEMFIQGKMTFALELKENHKVIGSLGLETLSLLLRDEYENLVGRELGYVLSKEYWGKGLMPEAVNRVIKFCFEQENYDYLRHSGLVPSFLTENKRLSQESNKPEDTAAHPWQKEDSNCHTSSIFSFSSSISSGSISNAVHLLIAIKGWMPPSTSQLVPENTLSLPRL